MRRAVTLQPGYSQADFDALLATRRFVIANCFTISPLEGAIIRLTDAQEDVSIVGFGDINRYTYSARQAVISGLRARSTAGIEVDEQEIEIAYSPDALFQNWRPWPEALLQGRLDGSEISRDWAIAEAWGAPWIGVIRMFLGVDPELDSVGRSFAKLKINSGLSRLNLDMPRDLYGIKCRYVFGDSRCGINLASLATLGTVGAGATRSIIPWASAAASYAFGKIHITNNDNVTRVRTIQKADGANLYLAYPLDFDPGAGLEFTAWPGCSRLSTGANGCQNYWGAAWPDHFGGCPFIPVAESAL